jgi:predicted dehydrogenase
MRETTIDDRMKLKIGFLGIGAMGLSHLKAMHEGCNRQAEAVAICANSESNIEKALAVAPAAKVFKDENALIHSDIDAIFVSTPNFTHAPLALEALRAGKHLFLEKPVGITRQECRELAHAVAMTDRVVLVGHELRYSPYFQRIKALIDSGEIGVPHLVWTREFRGPFQKKSRDWIQDVRKSGGALVDKNCHHFDLMNWWIGARPKYVCAFGGNAVNRVIGGEDQVLDHASVSFEYGNGVRGTLELCMFAPDLQGEDLQMGIIGDQGMIETRLSTLQIAVWKRSGESGGPAIHSIEAKRGQGWGGHLGFAEIHEAFVKAILEKQPHLTTVRECLDGTLLAIAAEESIRRRSVVEVDPA